MKVNNNQVATATKKQGTLAEWLDSRKSNMSAIIPQNTVNVDRFLQSAKMAIYNPKIPQLAQCTPESIYRSLMEAASYGLELSGALGQAYLIPYNESFKKSDGTYEKKMTCHFQMGYKGLIALARRSKTIKTIACECVYENDIFEVELACGRKITHKLDLKKDRGEVIAYYCLVELENGGIQFAVMSKKDVEKHRDQFVKMYKKDDKENNWNKNFDSMALKTCCIKALKLCPISTEELEAIRQEEIKEVEPVKSMEFEDAEYTVNENSEQLITSNEESGIDQAFEEQAELESPNSIF